MLKLLVLFLIFPFVVIRAEAGTSGVKQVHLQAEEISGDKTDLYAKGHIVLRYAQTVFMADAAHYDKEKKRLTVQGDVRIINPDGSSIETQKVTLDVQKEKVVFEKFFYRDEKNIWLSSTKAEKTKQCYQLNKAMFSTCAVSNPDWHLAFSEADYNATSKYITLKDIQFYAGSIPIFYFPYLAFSTSRDRSSGLLMPRLGYSNTDGLIYEQPVYWAISPSVDLEFNPQIRTDRSLGLYATLRFADSNHSEGFVRGGYFADKSGYASAYNLKHDTHYGVEAKYESSDLLGIHKSAGYEDALYANIVLFNDIDYLNLQKDRVPHLSDSHLKESRLNYMLHSQENYFGLNAKYFLDANKESNEDTLQELPSLRWHRYSSSLLGLENLSYGAEAKLSHFAREEGAQSGQIVMSLPLRYHLSFLDDYLKAEWSETLHAFAGNFDLNGTKRERYNALMATHKLKLYSDLIKPYSQGVHTIEWSAEYAHQNYLGDGLAEYNALDRSLRKDFLPYAPFDDKVTLALSQYWHSNDLVLGVKQRVSQTYYPDRGEAWGDLRHELMSDWGKWHLANLLQYSFEHDAFSEMSSKLTYGGEKLQVGIEYFWRKDLELQKILTDEIAFRAQYQYSKRLKLFGSISYDLDQHYSKKWSSGLRYDKGCWAVELGYYHDTKPILETSGGGAIDNNTFLVKLSLVPFGESEIRQ